MVGRFSLFVLFICNQKKRFRMGNLQKHAGPLSPSWHQAQFQLAKQIIQRMTDIGIIPVLPAFTGFMPRTAPA
jgi:alpha-N-acetylglucosaminidase